MKPWFEKEVELALNVLRSGGVILYPADTVWGLGCDATCEAAIEKIHHIKNQPIGNGLITLVAAERDILQYVADPDLAAFDFLENQPASTTLIFENAVGLPQSLLASDGSIALRIVQDEFCRHLIKRLQKPIVSTLPGIGATANSFDDISISIKNAVDYIVPLRQCEVLQKPSRVIRWKSNGCHEVVRP